MVGEKGSFFCRVAIPCCKSENELDGEADSMGEWARSDEVIPGHSSVDDDPASACGGVEY